MHLNVFAECSPSPQFVGYWRDPGDRTAAGYRSLAYWLQVARRLEDAAVDALFFADIHGVYDAYRGSPDTAIRHAVQVPSIDPVLVVAALLGATERLGFAVTYSTTYHPPYECARLFTTLDHLSGGRIAWNIVTSYLRSASRDGLGEYLDHDVRYDRADEYVEVVRRLWEESWDDGAVVRDVAADVFTDPALVHRIDHDGPWFRVRGPLQCEPSPQRTPVLYQAGASGRGRTFAARHAEVVFLTMADPASGAPEVAELRRLVAGQGRDPRSLKVMQGSMVLLGRTPAEARARADAYNTLWSAEGQTAKWCGWMDVDLAAYPDDLPVDELRSEGSRSFLGFLRRLSPDRTWTVGEVRYLVAHPRRPRRAGPAMLYGTVDQVADRMEQWLTEADVDGFNLLPCPPTEGIADICTLLVPELRRRGLFRAAFDPAERTLRERYFGAGVRSCRAEPVSA
jgi:FMN-dependent oxidoreductase (nitrilotriacetate monooxygenase family)